MEIQELNEKFQLWIANFSSAKTEPMSNDLSEIFLRMARSERNELEIPSGYNIYSYKILEKRAEFIGLKLNKYVKMFICMLVRSPGEIIMYLYYLKDYQVKNKEEITMEIIVRIFPYGFPTDDSLNILWDSQKINGENLLDKINNCFMLGIYV